MTYKYKSLPLFLLIASMLTACSDDTIISDSTTSVGDMTFNVNVLDAPESTLTTRGASKGNDALEAENNNSDFKAGDSFGLFVIDADGNTVDGFRNMKITTPDGKVWNALSSVKTTVHKMGYKYYAYAPYSADFDNLTSQVAIDNALTAPAEDQSTNAATDWMYTGATEPGTNGVTTLTFKHKYGVIDIFNSYNLNTCDWLTTYGSKATKTTDSNNVTHYRYILNDANASTLSVSGTYNVGNSNTGIRQFAYSTDIPIGNGYHSTVRTARVSEDYAVDLGLPSGVKWARFNLGAELGGAMTEEQILEAEQKWGTRLAWGELWQKDSYSSSTYIDESNTLFTSNISGTANDPVKMLWGGHWETPTQADFDELKNNVTITKTGPIIITATSINGSNPKEYKNIYVYKLTSKVEGYTDKSITMLTTGYVSDNLYSSAWSTDNTYYTSGTFSSAGKHKNLQIKPDCTVSINDVENKCGTMVRPVLKETTQWNPDDCERLVMSNLVKYSIDFGIRETIDGVEYATLWAPFNLGAEKTFASYVTYNGQYPVMSDMIQYARTQLGWYLAWGATEPYVDVKYTTDTYKTLAVYRDGLYNGKYNTTSDWSLELEDKYDAAKVNWGKWDSRWQMPTKADAEKMIAATTTVSESGGTNGYVLATGTKSGFESSEAAFPKCGYMDQRSTTTAQSTGNVACMTRTAGEYDASVEKMWMIWGNTDNGKFKTNSKGSRYTGVCVRPIIKIPVSELNK